MTTNGAPVLRPINWWTSATESRTNNVAACAADHIEEGDTASVFGKISLVTSAAFKDYANGNYTPTCGGALYNAGATVANPPSTDLAGQPRVVGKAIDIGCYEGKLSGMILMIK